MAIATTVLPTMVIVMVVGTTVMVIYMVVNVVATEAREGKYYEISQRGCVRSKKQSG